MPAKPLPLGVVLAPPLWTLSAEANARVMAQRAHAHAAAEILANLVTKHPTPYLADPVTVSALTLERLAQSRGMTTRMHVGLEGCTLEGRVGEQRLGFRASWRRGKADSASWISPSTVWGEVHDERPGPDAKIERRVKGKVTLVAHPNRMPHGLARDHLVQLESPLGVALSFAALTARVKALPLGT